MLRRYLTLSFSSLLLLALLFLTGCSFVRPQFRRGFRTQFKINSIPTVSDPYHINYDLTFSLNFASNKRNTYGTGWLIDWKGDENNPEKNDPFKVYLATNLHVIDALRNNNDYEPYNKDSNSQAFNGEEITRFFSIGKYTYPSIFSELNFISNAREAFVSIQTSTIPKTAYAAVNFVETQGEDESYTDSLSTDNKRDIYADFAVIEIPLFLTNHRDYQVFNEFIKPAIETYKQLGNSSFEKKQLDQHKNDNFYMLGYPLVESSIDALILNQRRQYNNSYTEKYTPQTLTKDQRTIDLSREVPTLIQNKTENSTGSQLLVNQSLSSTSEGIIEFIKLPEFKLNYHNKSYRQYGRGFALQNTNFRPGSSGTLMLNNQKQIAGIYFGVLDFGEDVSLMSNIGVGQILRVPQKNNTRNRSIATNKSNYDLIFGDSNTTNFYAKFARQNNTHLYQMISNSKDTKLKYVNTVEKTVKASIK